MKTRNFFSRVLTVVVSMAMCLTFNGILTSCDEASVNVTKSSGDEPVVPPTPVKVDTIDYVYNPQGGGHEVVNNDETIINGKRIAAPGFAKLELREYLVKLFGEDLPSLDNAAAAANDASELKRSFRVESTADGGRDTVFVTTLSTSIANNKNVATVTSETRRPVRYIDGKYIAGGYLVTDAITFTNINVIVPAGTRSADWVLSKEFDVAVGVDVIRHEAGLSHRAPKTNLKVHLADTFRVQQFVKNDIVDWKVKDSTRIATTTVDEYAQYTISYKKKDGNWEDGTPIYLPMNYYIKSTLLAEALVNNFSFKLSNKGSVAWESGESLVKTTETSKIYERHGSYSSLFDNNYEEFRTDYKIMSQRTIYDDGLVKLSTGYAGMEIKEGASYSDNVESDRDGYSKAIFTNNIQANYLNMAQPVQETKPLYSKKAEEDVVTEDWDYSSKKKTITATSVDVSVNWVEHHSLKEDKVTPFKKSYPIFVELGKPWQAFVAEFAQSTGAAIPNLKQSKDTAKEGDATWTAMKEVNSGLAQTTPEGASAQNNNLTATVYNDIAVSYKGKTCEFGHDSFSLSHDGGSLGSEYAVTDGKAKDFTLGWSMTFGGVSSSYTSNGTLIKKNEPKPEEDKVVSADFENPDETMTHTGYTPTIDWREKHSKESDKVTPLSCPFGRSASCVSNWSATVSRFHQNTASYSAKLVSSKHQSKIEGDFKWEWDDEVYRIEAKTSLTGADAQMNVVESSEVNNAKVTHIPSGKSYSWSKKSVAAPHDNGHLSKVNDKEYSYTLIMRYTFGGDVQEISCPGTLKMN